MAAEPPNCHTADPDPHAYAACVERVLRGAPARVDGDAVFLKVVYRVLVREGREAQDDVPLARLRAQHEMLQMILNRVNPSGERTPKTGHYAFYGVRGDASVVLLPVRGADLTEDDVERIAIPAGKTFQGSGALAEMTAFMHTRPGGALWNVPDVLNFFCAPMGGATIGQAYLHNNFCVLNNLTVGGPSALAPGLGAGNPGYEYGITGAHEVLHCFGLGHIFNAGACGAPHAFADVPRQKKANSPFRFSITQRADGTHDGQGCNRAADCAYYASLGKGQAAEPSRLQSCIDPADCAEGLYEQATNIMDYTGASRTMISVKQADYVHAWLRSADNTKFRLQPVPEDLPEIPVLDESSLVELHQAPPSGGPDAKLPVWAVASLGAVLFVVLVALVVYVLKRRPVR